MAMITSSEYGIVAVNNTVLCKIIIDDMLSMNADLVPCNKKGRVLKKSFFTGYNELYNAVELSDTPDGIKIKVYFILQTENKYEETSNKLFDKIEKDFAEMYLDEPVRLTANIKGFYRDKSVEQRDIEMIRRNGRG